MSTGPENDTAVSPARRMRRSRARCGSPILRAVLVGMILAASLACAAVSRETAAQEKEPGTKIVLDIPVRAPAPDDAQEHVTIVVRGMKKSRSGAT